MFTISQIYSNDIDSIDVGARQNTIIPSRVIENWIFFCSSRHCRLHLHGFKCKAFDKICPNRIARHSQNRSFTLCKYRKYHLKIRRGMRSTTSKSNKEYCLPRIECIIIHSQCLAHINWFIIWAEPLLQCLALRAAAIHDHSSYSITWKCFSKKKEENIKVEIEH